MSSLYLTEFVAQLNEKNLLATPTVGQKVVVADFKFSSPSSWDLKKALFQEAEISAVKRKYIYTMDKSGRIRRFDKGTFVEARTDGYSPSYGLFQSMEIIEQAIDYIDTASRLLDYFKAIHTLQSPFPKLQTLHEAEELLVSKSDNTSREKEESNIGSIFSVIEAHLAFAGYTILDGDGNSIVIRDKDADEDYAIIIHQIES